MSLTQTYQDALALLHAFVRTYLEHVSNPGYYMMLGVLPLAGLFVRKLRHRSGGNAALYGSLSLAVGAMGYWCLLTQSRLDHLRATMPGQVGPVQVGSMTIAAGGLLLACVLVVSMVVKLSHSRLYQGIVLLSLTSLTLSCAMQQCYQCMYGHTWFVAMQTLEVFALAVVAGACGGGLLGLIFFPAQKPAQAQGKQEQTVVIVLPTYEHGVKRYRAGRRVDHIRICQYACV
jgi:hypothetical protein